MLEYDVETYLAIASLLSDLKGAFYILSLDFL